LGHRNFFLSYSDTYIIFFFRHIWIIEIQFEFPDTNAVRIVIDIKCPDSDTILPFECPTLTVGRSDG
jgi:hypothetical protein